MIRIYSTTRPFAIVSWVALVSLFPPRAVGAQEPVEAPAPDAPTPAPRSPAPEAPPPEVAPDAPPPTAPTAPRIEAPSLLEGREAPYPEAALADSRAGTVGLELVIDANGQVTSAQVIESAGDGFDEAARAAALAFRFSPAKRDGIPVAAVILYRYEFAPPPPPAPAVVEGPPLVVVAPVALPPATPVAETEVRVQGELSEIEKLQKSADAVTVVDLDEARKRSSDMGEILARTPGVVIRRAGGLGSDTRFSLNGLYGRSVPMFVDSVPLWLSGFPENAASIQVNLVHHVEIYHGVVPLRLSADALGGAVNFVTDKSYENHASASYQMGSFGLYRATGLAQYRHEATGFVARLSGYVDDAKNNYPVDVEVPDDRGRLSPATVERFHDAYRSYSLMAETGFVDRSWAKRFLVKGFFSDLYKEVQNNVVMSVPYGEVTYGDLGAGGNMLYEQDFSDTVNFQVVTTFSHRAFDFVDVSEWVYDWYGQRVRERRVPGEIESKPTDQTTWRNAGFGRALLEWNPTPEQVVVFSTTPLFSTQTGDERRQLDPTARDPLSARQELAKVVTGVGHEWNLVPLDRAPPAGERRRGTDYALQNMLNLKSYYYHAAAEEPLPGGVFRYRDKETLSFGIGDSLRYAFTPWLYVKASYEYATRLPDPFETFGDGFLTLANLDLVPEVSHNANFGPILDAKRTSTGDWVLTLNGFLRDSDNMIVLLGNDRFYSYQNVYRALTQGVEAGISWTAPRRLVSLDTNATYTDSRNASDEGTFADFKGDRIPNRPSFTSSWAARFLFEHVFAERGNLEPFYQGRFVEGFYRGWESQGLPEFKQTIPSQLSHDAGITYTFTSTNYRLATTLECQNFTNEKLYDDFGLQRPGRAFFWKLTGDLF